MQYFHRFVKKLPLKSYYIKYKPFLTFVTKFFLIYILLSWLYGLYLGQFDEATFEPDGITTLVSDQTRDLLNFFGEEATTRPHELEPSHKFAVHGKFVARIVEGCNAVSVMILFVAFVVAFKGKLKHTLLFILGGILIIHILNILRIALLVLALYYYPEYQEILHGTIFPLVIYSVVFILWVIWVNKFSVYARKK